MRFFSGSRDMNKKKGSASQLYKDKMNTNGKKAVAEDPQAIYKRQMEDRMAKMMEDILLGRKKNATSLPGCKPADDKPKEVSKSTMMMLRLLAERREQKDRKALRKRELAYVQQEKAKKNLEKQQQLAAELLIQQKEEEYKAAEAAKNTNWWGTTSDENKSWW